MRAARAGFNFFLSSVLFCALIWMPSLSFAFSTAPGAISANPCHQVKVSDGPDDRQAIVAEMVAGRHSCDSCPDSQNSPHKEKSHSPCCNHSVGIAWFVPIAPAVIYENEGLLAEMSDLTYLKVPTLDGPFQPPRMRVRLRR